MADDSLFADAFPRIEEIRQENLGGDVSAKDIAWLCEVAEAAARLCVHLSRVEPMQFKREVGCVRWNRLSSLLQDDPTGVDPGVPSTGQEYRHRPSDPQIEIQAEAMGLRFVPEGDERCDFVMDACMCMKRKGHDGLHACAHGGWRTPAARLDGSSDG